MGLHKLIYGLFCYHHIPVKFNFPYLRNYLYLFISFFIFVALSTIILILRDQFHSFHFGTKFWNKQKQKQKDAKAHSMGLLFAEELSQQSCPLHGMWVGCAEQNPWPETWTCHFIFTCLLLLRCFPPHTMSSVHSLYFLFQSCTVCKAPQAMNPSTLLLF